jgi:hypothetical protein
MPCGSQFWSPIFPFHDRYRPPGVLQLFRNRLRSFSLGMVMLWWGLVQNCDDLMQKRVPRPQFKTREFESVSRAFQCCVWSIGRSLLKSRRSSCLVGL